MKSSERPSTPHFYFKVSKEPFEFDTTVYHFKHVHQTSRSVFMSNDDGIRIFDEGGILEIRAGTASLSHARIAWNELSSTLEVELDSFGVQSVFYHDSGDSIYLSNRVDTLARTLPAPELCDFALSFYLLAGFLPAGRTFWKKIRRVAARSKWDLRLGKSRHEANASWQPVRNKMTFTPNEVIESLKDSLARIQKEIAPTQMRLSGGADSRIISFLWNSPIETSTVRTPWMEKGSDLDVNLAKAWAEFRGFSHCEMEPDPLRFAFFGEPSEKPMLAGLCGGEFLGGQFERVIPSCPVKWRAALENDFSPEFAETLRADSWFQDVSRDKELWLVEAARVFVQSARSTIYGSVVGSWSAPCELYFSAVSPFVTAPFLEIFLSAIGTWGDYEFYEDVFRALGPEVRHVPLSSQLTLRAKELAAGNEWGQEPKAARPRSVQRAFEEQAIERMASVLGKNGVDLSCEKVSELFESSSFRINAISLYNWIDARAMMKKDEGVRSL